jgi:signal transduction histidine kinase
MRRIPIRIKLAAALTVPLLGLFLLTVLEVVSTSREVDDVRSQTELARASIGPEGVLSTLQNERTWAAVDLIGSAELVTVPVVGYDESRAQTDAAVASFRETLEGESREVAQAYAPGLDRLSDLDEIRATIDGSTNEKSLANAPFADEVYARYTELITPYFEANDQVAVAVDDADLREITTLVGLATRQVETVGGLARRTLLDVIGGGVDQASEIAAVAELKAAFDSTNEAILNTDGPYESLVADHFPHALIDPFAAQVEAAIAGQPVDVPGVLATLNQPPEDNLMGFREVLVGALNERADHLDDAASGRERIFIGLAVVTLAAAVLLTWLVSRSITRPLRSLTRQAKEMAERRLPDAVRQILDTPLGEDVAVPTVDPVRVQTRDEVADVADALNTVQDTALDLAIEQAVLRRNIADSFVNLGRRNQNLLGRQLDFITELESNETDPQSLANLFRLDHLATRMRRNAESLLVLAGIEPPRQWAAPVRVSDVIRAALGEVENYQRVNVRGVEPATIVGSAAADLAHLLAELVENSLVFSPPDQTVDIRGHNRTDGPLGHSGYTLAVIDSGLGMPRADLAAANRRLAGTESFTIAPSKYLGHYVAGNLAARHGIRVHLDETPGNGITATITLPMSMLTTEQVTTAPVTPPHGQRAASLPTTSRPGEPAPTRGGGNGGAPASLPPAPARPAGPAPAPPASGPGSPAMPWPMGPVTGPQPTIPAGEPFVPRPLETPAHGTPAVTAAGPGPTTWPAPPGTPAPPGAAPAPPGAPQPGRPPADRLWPARMPAVTRTGEHPAIPDDAAPPASTTAGGLARRRPGGEAAAPTTGPRPAIDQALIDTWERRHQPRGGRDPARRPAEPPPMPAPTNRRRVMPPEELARRVRGAQLPQTGVVPLRSDGGAERGSAPTPPRPSDRSPAPPASRPGLARAHAVQALLTDFTAGVQRGLAEARREPVSPGRNGSGQR